MKVLLAEDTAVGRTIATAMLVALGCDVTAVDDGEAALREVLRPGEAGFAAALLDLNLPGLAGLQVARGIAEATSAAPALTRPRLIATSAAEPDWMGRELARGTFQHFLPKPLRPAGLARALGLGGGG